MRTSRLAPALLLLLLLAAASFAPRALSAQGAQGPAGASPAPPAPAAPAPTHAAAPAPGLAGLAWADVDADGRVDVLAPRGRDGVVLLLGVGAGAFEDATALFGLGELEGVRQAAFADAQGDGLPDLFVLAESARLLSNEGGVFVDVTLESGLGELGELGEVTAGFWYDYDGDAAPDLVLQTGGGVRLLRNDGRGAFASIEMPVELLADPVTAATGDRPAAAGGERAAVAQNAAVSAGAAPAADRGPLPGSAGPAGDGAGSPGGVDASSVGASTPAGPEASALLCAGSLMDAATAACLQASSNPVIGALYPLSDAFNVDGAGRVGMSTVDPLATLHVEVLDRDVPASALVNDGLVVESSDAVLGLYSSAGGSWGSGIALGEVGAGALVDKWAIARRTSPADSSLRFTHGTNANYASNPTVMTLHADGRVGIGNDLSLARFAVTHTGSEASAGVFENGGADNTDASLFAIHYGPGDGVFSLSVDGAGVTALGDTGVDADGSEFGVHARTDGGIALQAINESSETGLGAHIQNATAAAALLVSSTHPTPNAAFLAGKTQVGYLGAFGIPVHRVEFEVGPDSNSGVMRLYNSLGNVCSLSSADSSGAGYVRMYNGSGAETVRLDAADSSDSGFLQLFQADGSNTITLDSNSGGDGRIITDVIEIRGGADLVEAFETREVDVEPGSVVAIDPASPGALALAREPYDRKVAGVVSGAGGVKAGVTMGRDVFASGDTPVALTGRVYVKASAENGPIRAGDRLTTSATAGHAMRVTDEERAPGAVIGKAMTELDEGTGLVLVLVNLQ